MRRQLRRGCPAPGTRRGCCPGFVCKAAGRRHRTTPPGQAPPGTGRHDEPEGFGACGADGSKRSGGGGRSSRDVAAPGMCGTHRRGRGPPADGERPGAGPAADPRYRRTVPGTRLRAPPRLPLPGGPVGRQYRSRTCCVSGPTGGRRPCRTRSGPSAWASAPSCRCRDEAPDAEPARALEPMNARPVGCGTRGGRQGSRPRLHRRHQSDLRAVAGSAPHGPRRGAEAASSAPLLCPTRFTGGRSPLSGGWLRCVMGCRSVPVTLGG